MTDNNYTELLLKVVDEARKLHKQGISAGWNRCLDCDYPRKCSDTSGCLSIESRGGLYPNLRKALNDLDNYTTPSNGLKPIQIVHSPNISHAVMYKDDCERIIKIMADHGYDCSIDLACSLWEMYSESMAASWMMLSVDDESVFKMISGYFKERPSG